ncbi:hypothetical protein ACQWFT_24530, partial [Salmonella enterica subsp. enterica serovar Infantis]
AQPYAPHPMTPKNHPNRQGRTHHNFDCRVASHLPFEWDKTHQYFYKAKKESNTKKNAKKNRANDK